MGSEFGQKFEAFKKFLPFLEDIIKRLDTSPVTGSSVQADVEGLQNIRELISHEDISRQMGPEYEKKFEAFKKFLPFLDDIITRLDTSPVTGSSVQADVEGLQNIRELISHEENRITKEKFQEGQEILVGLDTKMESPIIDPAPGCSKDPPTLQEKSGLAKQQEDKETLSEMLNVEETGEMHTAGSSSSAVSPTHHSLTKINGDKVIPQTSAPKRYYTRVLVSPDASRRWSMTESAEVNPLLNLSLRTSPTSYSPSSHKKGRNISSEELLTHTSKCVNIPLHVPEDNLSSLYTKDILIRIINCEDGDINVEILRKLRKQISRELKKIGSYNKNIKSINVLRKKAGTGQIKLSDGEFLEFTYGSLSGMLVLKDRSEAKTSTDKGVKGQIQICLVINLELETCDKENKALFKTGFNEETNEEDVVVIDDDDDIPTAVPDRKMDIEEDISTIEETSKNNASEILQQPSDEEKKVDTPNEPVKYRANFLNPLTDSSEPVEKIIIQDSKEAEKEAEQEAEQETEQKAEQEAEQKAGQVEIEEGTEIGL